MPSPAGVAEVAKPSGERRLGLRIAIAIAIVVGCAIVGALGWWIGRPQPRIRVRLATTAIAMSAGVFLAEMRGAFAEHGLDVELQLYPSGKDALAAAIGGVADLATVSGTPLMHALVKHEPVAVWATLGECRGLQCIVARGDRGISRADDLVGKSIALPLGTSAEIFALSYLRYHGLDPSRMAFVDHSLDESVDALVAGEVDAVSLWEPYASRAASAHPGTVTLRQDTIGEFSWNLVGRRDDAVTRSALVPLLHALLATYAELHRLDGQQTEDLAQRCGVSAATLSEALITSSFRIHLDSDLAIMLEAESELLYGVESRQQNAFADAIDASPLRNVDPSAVAVDW